MPINQFFRIMIGYSSSAMWRALIGHDKVSDGSAHFNRNPIE